MSKKNKKNKQNKENLGSELIEGLDDFYRALENNDTIECSYVKIDPDTGETTFLKMMKPAREILEKLDDRGE